MSAPVAGDEFGQAMERVGALIDALEQQPDGETLQQARELLHAVLELHGIGLAAIWEQLQAHGGEALSARLGRDARIAALLDLHALPLPEMGPQTGVEAERRGGLIPIANLLRGHGAQGA